MSLPGASSACSIKLTWMLGCRIAWLIYPSWMTTMVTFTGMCIKQGFFLKWVVGLHPQNFHGWGWNTLISFWDSFMGWWESQIKDIWIGPWTLSSRQVSVTASWSEARKQISSWLKWEHEAVCQFNMKFASQHSSVSSGEHVAVYQSVLRHRQDHHGTFRVVELGARWGTWGARACAFLRLVKPEVPYEVRPLVNTAPFQSQVIRHLFN